ncbi:tetratricopeptide repeat protein [Frigoriflavimonas asaccharolytica]|uniref:Tetratricopeptide (TPR) repeat protein n=1 Tax=Frigoriflavimonas asaccharolytica TaxID=2735899 RepID=A0A8J8G9H9_9FLAO|nr:tetratricopeptide repeat protein [Frigoriflavimonas asaccharolytica]NRS91994.1 tetratricopeptide (TPR) repeat protein [Frigoriflavimonas asaccharolytica]
MNNKKILLASIISLSGIVEAQNSQYFSNIDSYEFNLAENLYQTKVYNASQYEYAQQYFYNSNLSNSKKEAAQFFDNIIGVILQKNHAEKGLAAFMKEYPNSAYFAKANLPLADFYLAKKDFPKALETLQKINQYQLTADENTQYIMKLGYAKFMTGDAKGATRALEEAYKSGNETTKPDVAYMLGHLYYADKQIDKSFQYLDTIKENPKYSKLVRPYYVQLFYNDKNYDKAIAEGKMLLNEDISTEYKAEVHKIIGESYFMKKDYAAAYPSLKIFLESKENPTESDLYEAGFVAAQLKKYEEAVGYYNQLINNQSQLSQNAYYQLGNAYLEIDKKQEALSAFRSAYQMTFDASVQQLAHEQYAKLSYDIGNPFEAAPSVIQSYIVNYPKSNKISEMKKLLVKSYLYSGNYKETLKAIDEVNNASSEINKINQEVSYLLGTEEFNKGNYDAAEQYFNRSLKFNLNTEFNDRANYWLAQTYYQKGNYPSAIVRFEKLLNASEFPEKSQLNYDLGYSYFKSKKFDKAQNYFKNYLKNPNPSFKNDAELRLADTYYANNQLSEAIAIYDKAENADDYTLFQKGMSLGFQGNSTAKISALKNLLSQFPKSEYADDAQYEIAVAYASTDDFNNSNDYFQKVKKSSEDLDLIANAKIYTAQNYIDQNQNQNALSEFQSLASEYRNTAYSSKIVQAARPLFLKSGDISGYENFAKNAGVKINASEIDELNLSSAQQFYAKKDFAKAIPFYEKYLTENPTGEGKYQAEYELGESYFQNGNPTKALLTLQNVGSSQNDYQQDAQTRIAQIYISQGNSTEAKKYLDNLSRSSNSTIKNFANVELMKIYSDEKDFKNAEKFADLVLLNSKNSPSVVEQAKVIKARSLMNSGKDKDAQTAYAALEKSGNTEVAAESLYAKAFYQNKGKAFKSSNETIFKLANNYASEEYWGAKALVLMAKNYIGLKDNYQASYTADQIIANYKDFPEIVAEAKAVKSQIKK